MDPQTATGEALHEKGLDGLEKGAQVTERELHVEMMNIISIINDASKKSADLQSLEQTHFLQNEANSSRL